MAVSYPKRLFTVAEYYEMARVGILKPDERVELLDGEIVPMKPIGSPHHWCVTRTASIFWQHVGRVIVSVQGPLRLHDRSEPEPDIVIIPWDAPQDRHPGPDEALLVIEVADSSIRIDRGRKRRMYAQAGIAEYWIVDLSADRIEIYRDPGPRGYRSTALAGRGESISPLFDTSFSVDVSTVLGEPALPA
jgi:Uma2 family endonuclease